MVHLFEAEYLVDPDEAISNLLDRLEGQRAIVKRWTFAAINRRHPGIL